LKWATDEKTSDLSIYAEKPYTADIWFWKAHRTDEMGYSDDKWQKLVASPQPKTVGIKSRSGAKMFLLRKGDVGQPAYKSVLHLEKTEKTLGQYAFQKPSESRADIQAKGSWKEGRWTVEFVRALKTGHDDDVQFDLSKTYLFGISRNEIAGKKPNPELTQPLYGAGDVSERLKLTFVQKKK